MSVEPFSVAPYHDLPPFDLDRAAAAVRELLVAVGEDPDREGLKETPARVARAYAELLRGMRMQAEDTEFVMTVLMEGTIAAESSCTWSAPE